MLKPYFVRRLICLIAGHKEVKHYDWGAFIDIKDKPAMLYLVTQCERCGSYKHE